jgi:hypothetical protein
MVARNLAEPVIVNIGCTLTCNHRVDRVLNCFSVVANWDPPTPPPAGEFALPPFGSWGRDTITCRKGFGVGGGPKSDEGTDTVVLYYVRNSWYICTSIPSLMRATTVNVSYPTQSVCNTCTVHVSVGVCTGFGRLLFATHLLNFAYKNQE